MTHHYVIQDINESKSANSKMLNVLINSVIITIASIAGTSAILIFMGS